MLVPLLLGLPNPDAVRRPSGRRARVREADYQVTVTVGG